MFAAMGKKTNSLRNLTILPIFALEVFSIYIT